MAEDNTSFCDSFKAAAVQCVAMDTSGQCPSCIDIETMGESFPADIKKLFASTQAFAIPGTEQFCSVANDRICAEVDAKYSCCCDEQIAAWQSCLVENVYSQDLSLAKSCSSSCSGSGGGADGGSSTAIIGAVVAIVAMLLAGGGWWFCRRRRIRAAEGGIVSDNSKEKHLARTDSVREAGTLDDMADSVREAGTLDDMEEGRSSGSSGEEDTPQDPIPKTIVSTQSLNDKSLESESSEERPKPSKRASSRARDKKKAIEEWNKMKKTGSNRSLESFVSKNDSDDEEAVPEKKSSRDRESKEDSKFSAEKDRLGSTQEKGSGKVKLPKKISSRDLGRIIKENTENATKVRDMKQEIMDVEDRLYSADREAEKLRRDRDEVQKRLEELEAQNKALRKEARSRSKSRDSTKRRSSRDKSGERKSSSSRDKSSERRRSRSRSRS